MSDIIIKGKDETKKILRNNIIYNVNCKDCEVSYVGQTKRYFEIRKGEHQKQKSSVIFQHCNSGKHNFDWKNFKILNSERNRTKRDISEMLQIKIQKQPINKQEDTQKLSCIYTNTLQKFKRTNHEH